MRRDEFRRDSLDKPARTSGVDDAPKSVGAVRGAGFNGENPVGRTVEIREGKELFAAMTIVGYVRDAVYSSVREDIRPEVYFPIGKQGGGAYIVRVSGDPRATAPLLRQEMVHGSGLVVRNIDTQSPMVSRQMVRDGCWRPSPSFSRWWHWCWQVWACMAS